MIDLNQKRFELGLQIFATADGVHFQKKLLKVIFFHLICKTFFRNAIIT